MKLPSFFHRLAHPLSISGATIHAPLLHVFIGELCLLRRSISDRTVVGRAQVTGLNQKGTVLTLLGHSKGLGRDVVLHPTGSALRITAPISGWEKCSIQAAASSTICAKPSRRQVRSGT